MPKIYKPLGKLKVGDLFNYEELSENVKREKQELIFHETLNRSEVNNHIIIHNDCNIIVVAIPIASDSYKVRMIVQYAEIYDIINDIEDMIWNW